MTIGLLIVLALIFILPFTFRSIEHNLEYFLLAMGISATILSRTLSLALIIHIFENNLLYFITAAVLIAGLVFRLSVNKIKKFVSYATKRVPIALFVFLLIVVLGLVSSFITAIIAALILVEIVHVLPFNQNQKVRLTIIACFSIGLGSALTPIGEPLSTIVVSSLNVDFFYLIRNIGIYIIPGIVALGLFGSLFIVHRHRVEKAYVQKEENITYKIETENIIQMESLQSVFIRAFKIFLFIIALELLGAGFKPLINMYVIHLDSRILYWINLSSAVLDNATIAAAEVSPAMSLKQIQAILMGLLLSGGMLIPGNIPNIISAGKLNIKIREWAKIGIPLGFVLLLIYFVVIFKF
ncbi:MAG: SLC13 family permease [Ruminiclostridium sp.]